MEESFMKVNPYDLTSFLKTVLGIETKKSPTHISTSSWLLTCDEWATQLTQHHLVITITHPTLMKSSEWLAMLKAVDKVYLFKLIQKLYYKHILQLKCEGKVWGVAGYCPKTDDRYYVHDEIGYSIRRKDGFLRHISNPNEFIEDIARTTICLPIRQMKP